MQVLSIQLYNFRNYRTLNIDFDKNTNIFYGNNAQGKSNILEAIYLAATAHSFRQAKDKDLIFFGEAEAHIRLSLLISGVEQTIDLHLRREKSKGIAINQLPIHRIKDLLSLTKTVCFCPDDLYLIKDGPAKRRQFLDAELCQIDQTYLFNLISYNKTLIQRNKLIKDIPFRPSLLETLDSWDEQLFHYGSQIIKKRKLFLSDIQETIRHIHWEISDHKEEISLKYEPDTDDLLLLDKIKNNRETDIKLKTTTCGPHRDDFSILTNGINLRKYGSQGQQRTAALSLKLSEIDIIRNNTSESPVLLLDDVLSELDTQRQNLLLKNIKGIQTFITCTGLDEFIQNHFTQNRTFHVVDGTIT